MKEEWKIYKEYFKPWNAKNPKRHVVEISNYGRVRKDNKIIVDYNPNLGKYIQISGGRLLHREVARLFIPNPENKPCIDHIDCRKSNNRVDNLRWVTYSENMLNPLTRMHNSNVQKESNKGEKNGMYGKKHSTESIEKMSKIKLNTICVNNSVEEKFIHEDKLQFYLDKGYVKGRIKFSDEHINRIREAALKRGKNKRRRMNNGIKEINVLNEEVEKYINEGYVLGRLKKN